METKEVNKITFEEFKSQIITDYKTAFMSREVSLLGRREVLTGKAKFGIFGDGKELPQIAMSRVFKNGDFRSGYYRDQTFMFAIGQLTVEQFFAQLYALTDLEKEPASGGRQMTSHFGTRSLNEDGSWKKLTDQKNSSADISPTAGQMPRLLGLAQASKYYRNVPEADTEQQFSVTGNEIGFGTIGDASTSEGHFWETINAGGVLQVPMIVSIWDDGYGISVPAKFQRTKSNLSELLSGFERTAEERGYEIISVKAWDYAALIEAYSRAESFAREHHIPCIVHVQECTQPQGHSTSGSHERYKSEDRLEWEKDFDGIKKFREYILAFGDNSPESIISAEELEAVENQIKAEVKSAQKQCWDDYLNPILELKNKGLALLQNVADASSNAAFINIEINNLKAKKTPFKRDVYGAIRKVIRLTREENNAAKTEIISWLDNQFKIEEEIYSTKLVSGTATNVAQVAPSYPENPEMEDGRVIVRDNFDKIFEKYPKALIFGEDAGNIGDVNQGLEGLQAKYGIDRISDTGIREATILGQGIGLAMRGLRPIAEIQYLDYILYCLQGISDDLATVLYRSNGGQKAPVIIRTRGHRLEGVWHSGSPMGGILNLVRGVNVLVPRDLTKAAGFYNTLMQADEPAIVVESLNGYRLKEPIPTNIGDFTTPIGEVEVTKEGKDITLLTYGSTWRIVMEAAKELEQLGISAEVIDAQSLLPFDIKGDVAKSLAKTNRLLIIDEDVPGGASAFLLQEIIEKQGGYFNLDSAPTTLTAKAHRPAYATDGDYFSKPSVDDMVEKVYEIMHEAKPNQFPALY
ncbi:Pyruvate/2-oxoglutarate/acetoin dehydrogenase complex, dehydrogenase (E1) component [Algoriella xinjiangensis]|uniref:3-methyl-2-oxobutanoate dehydrogenase (2-methylpropanoyl-transferring) n=1 Tax=Algoriella xinjiangensis TaxID=684065 RepID=A0A1I4VBG4_9FLAO|nr:alpha-ketoacid dehydrogenase subunit alpha/beta [Algoriella xinjiangensis]SFM98532.1 Pyruvate/2-oxoglutarate/acetoin dehydrogenase complex, dehydrogenase (E1) component [Algoriella xinjiangensis]